MKVDDAEQAKLGELMVRKGVLNRPQLERALTACEPFSLPLASTVLKLGLAEESVLLSLMVEHYGVTGIDLGASVISTSQLSVLPRPVAKSHCVLPLARKGNELLCAIADPAQQSVLDEIAFASGLQVVPFVCLHTRISRTIDAAYSIKKSGQDKWMGDRRVADELHLEFAHPVNSGKTIPIDFDISAEPLEAQRVAQSLPQSDLSTSPLVFIVDEDEEVIQLLSAQLESQDVEVITGNQGAAVIAQLERHRPDILVLDSMTSDVSGLEVCAKIKTSPRYQHIPIAVLSSMADGWNIAEDVKRLFHADAFIAKPFQVAYLVRWIEDALHDTGRRERSSELAAAIKNSAQESRRAIALYEAGDLEAAVETARRAVRTDPLDARGHFVLGTILNALGETFAAIAQYERAVAIAPTAFYPLKNLAIIYERQGFTGKSVEMWVRALGNCPSQAIRQTIKAHLVGLL